MKVEFGNGKTEYGPGVAVHLDGTELATAVLAYLAAHNIYHGGPLTVRVNGELRDRALCDRAQVYIDPSGWVIHEGVRYTGRGEVQE